MKTLLGPFSLRKPRGRTERGFGFLRAAVVGHRLRPASRARTCVPRYGLRVSTPLRRSRIAPITNDNLLYPS
jgi:hypothetical protein